MADCALKTKLPHLLKTSGEVFQQSAMTGISQQFCVRWNSHLGSLGAAFPQLLAGQQFVDVTLACDGHQVHCHRLVLAACSSYFESLLSENPCKHPIIILPKDIKLWEIHALVDFMYKGQVNVSQAGLPQLLKCAETLQIRGLCGTDSTLNEVANGKNCDALGATNLLPNNCSPNFNFTSMFASNLLNPNYQSNDDQLRQQQQQHQQQQQQQHQQHQQQQQQHQHIADIQRIAVATATTDNAKLTNHRSNEMNLVKTQKSHKHSANNDTSTKENHLIGSTNKHVKRINDISGNELNIKCEEIDDSDLNVGNGEDDDDELSNSKQAEYAMANVVCEYANESPRPTSAAAGSIHLDDSGLNTDYRSLSPPPKRFAGDSYYGSMSEPGRRIRRSESLLRQAADNVSRGQTFQTVSDMFQIPISTIRFFMARKGILPRRKRGRASTATIDIDDTSMHSNRPSTTVEADSCSSNKLNNSEQPITRPDEH